ncbi:MAG: hypothetical protein ACQETD_10020 [Pseudomonadota bacterium]
MAIPVQAAMVWQPAPKEGAPQGHGGHRGGKPFQLSEGEGAAAALWLPTRVRRPLPLAANQQVMVGSTGVDNYHLLYAKKRRGGSEQVALRYLYKHGKPSGESPSALLEAPKAQLEIVPAPLTREHQRYQSQKPFNFIVRFNGEPLSGKAITLTTSNGSALKGETDRKGRFTLHLPDDFAEVKPGRRSNPPAEFVLVAEHEGGGTHYQTTLSAPYYVSPSHWRSTGGGVAAMFAGVLTGFVVLRRSRKGENSAGRA